MPSRLQYFSPSVLAVAIAHLLENPQRDRRPADNARGHRRVKDFVPPVSRLTIACASVILAFMFRAGGLWIGSDLRFAVYLPAVLIIALLSGTSLAIGATIVVILVDWWIFFFPNHHSDMLNQRELLTLIMFLLASGSIIWLAYGCRVVLDSLHEQKVANEVLAKELDHRNRNFLSVIELVVRKTLIDEQELANKILDRIRAIQRANGLLTTIDAHSIKLKSLLALEFAPYGEDRLRLDGPDFTMQPDMARNLILIVHELVTNAAKYGCLSHESGCVTVDWLAKRSSVELHWRERGGPKVKPPSKQGFGSELIAQCVVGLSAAYESKFSDDGFECSIAFPILDYQVPD
jgi:two-component sensor histidine kinase